MEAWVNDIILSSLAIIFSGAMGWCLGKMDEREAWNRLIATGIIPRPKRG